MFRHTTANLPSVSHTIPTTVVHRCPPGTFHLAFCNEDEHLCHILFSLLLFSSCRSHLPSLSVSVLTSWCLSCSPALSAVVWGLYIFGGAACLGDCIIPCAFMCVCVCCVRFSMCMCRMKCRFPFYASHTHRGGGCCVRSEGAVGVLSELDLGFFSLTHPSVGVMALLQSVSI